MKENVKLIPEVFFDIISYLFPGGFFVLFLISNSSFPILEIFKVNNGIKDVFIIIIGGYFCGHLLTTVSHFLIVTPLNYLFGDPIHTLIGVDCTRLFKKESKFSDDIISKISIMIKKKFGTPVDKHSFFLCENFIRLKHPEIGFIIRKRHAFEHLCRNTAVALILLMLILNNSKELNILYGIFAIVSLIRYMDYRITWPKVVYESFYLVSLDKCLNNVILNKE